MEVIKYPDPRLSMVCEDVSKDEYKEALFIADTMKKTLNTHIGAVGLAANQVGILSRIIIVKLKLRNKVMINPVIIAQDNLATSMESCLSLPGAVIRIPRYNQITVEYIDENLKLKELTLSGFSATVVLHEIDHLNGKTLLDYKQNDQVESMFSSLKKIFQYDYK